MYLELEEVMSIECREKISLHYRVYVTSTACLLYRWQLLQRFLLNKSFLPSKLTLDLRQTHYLLRFLPSRIVSLLMS